MGFYYIYLLMPIAGVCSEVFFSAIQGMDVHVPL